MRPYYDDGTVTIYHDDCRAILPILAADLVPDRSALRGRHEIRGLSRFARPRRTARRRGLPADARGGARRRVRPPASSTCTAGRHRPGYWPGSGRTPARPANGGSTSGGRSASTAPTPTSRRAKGASPMSSPVARTTGANPATHARNPSRRGAASCGASRRSASRSSIPSWVAARLCGWPRISADARSASSSRSGFARSPRCGVLRRSSTLPSDATDHRPDKGRYVP